MVILLFTVCFSIYFVFYIFGKLVKGKNIVYIYIDDGVSRESVSQLIFTLVKGLPSGYRVSRINAKEIISNKWVRDAALLIMPGGADLPYVRKLNGQGNKNIKDYVKNGGAYLGICAGSYYGSAYVEFDRGGKFEVLGERELAFFPGVAVGPILAKHDHNSNSGSRAASIKLDLKEVKKVITYYNGGGYFKNATNYDDVTIIGYYENHLPAIIHISLGKGDVILSGVHFEYDPYRLDTQDPYLNKISPDLKYSNDKRQILVQVVFKKLLLS